MEMPNTLNLFKIYMKIKPNTYLNALKYKYLVIVPDPKNLRG